MLVVGLRAGDLGFSDGDEQVLRLTVPLLAQTLRARALAEEQAVGLRNRAGEPVAVDVSSPEDLPDLPAAVEVAAYRIVTEALTNVARHSNGPEARVRLDATAEALSVEVTDTGRSGDWQPWVGLSSMRERAAELGGTLEAGPSSSGGRVAALLPL